MAPIKFEEHVKEKLDGREIKPSAGSWDKLNSRLDKNEKSSATRWWIPAVAAVAVLLLASIFFVKQQGQVSENPVIVDTPKEENLQKPQKEAQPETQLASEENKEQSVQKKDKVAAKPEIFKTKTEPADQRVAGNDKKVEETLEVISQKAEIFETDFESPVIADESSEDLQKKIQDVLIKISEEEKASGNFTDAEVDALLAEAATEISRERDLYKSGSVNAAELLADVEYEVDESFRKEVFDFLKEEFLKAKTAVATRND